MLLSANGFQLRRFRCSADARARARDLVWRRPEAQLALSLDSRQPRAAIEADVQRVAVATGARALMHDAGAFSWPWPATPDAREVPHGPRHRRRSRGLSARRGSGGGAAAAVRAPFRKDRRGRDHRADVAPRVAGDARAHRPPAGRVACGARSGSRRDGWSRAPGRWHGRSVGHSTWRRGDGRAGREVE